MAGLVRCALAEDDPERARELAERFLGVHPDHAELHLVLAETLLLDGRPREALREASAGLDDLPWSPWALSLDARAHWALGEPDVAIDRLKDALDLTPVDVGLRAELAAWLLDVGRRAEAVRTIRPVARLLPDDADVQALAREAEDALAAERRR
jgi:predicted Zn-dependent protease